MDWISKLISTLKIPLKILLPTACIFSGVMIFLPDTILSKLNLLEWSNENGFVFGLLFTISICLITIYVLYYFGDKLKNLILKLTLNRRTAKKMAKFSDRECELIIYLYKQEGYTGTIDYSDPVTKSLIARRYVYIGNNALVEVGLGNEMITNGTLQPFVWQSLNWLEQKLERRINKLNIKKAKTKKTNKLFALEKELSELNDILHNIKN